MAYFCCFQCNDHGVRPPATPHGTTRIDFIGRARVREQPIRRDLSQFTDCIFRLWEYDHVVSRIGNPHFGHDYSHRFRQASRAAQLRLLPGRTSAGLGYAACATELLLAPFIPSNTARGGGILAPVIRGINESLSEGTGATTSSTNRYLIATAAHANLITSAMFLTAMAANPIVAQLAEEIYNIPFTWTRWFVGAVVPGLMGLLLLPPFIGLMFRDREMNVQSAHRSAKDGLRELGPHAPQ